MGMALLQRVFAMYERWDVEKEKIDEMLEYIEIYVISIESPDENDKQSKRDRELYKCLNNNKEGLLSYDKVE